MFSGAELIKYKEMELLDLCMRNKKCIDRRQKIFSDLERHQNSGRTLGETHSIQLSFH